MAEVIHFIKEVKLNYLRDNYRTGFGIFRNKLEKDVIKKLVAEINQAIFDFATSEEVKIFRNTGDKVFEVMVPLDKRDKVVVDIPIEVISKTEYRILWDETRVIPYVRADEMKLKPPEASAVEERMSIENAGKGEEVKGIPGEEPEDLV